MIEPVVMDYDGKPVSIEEGEMLWWDEEDGTHWNPQTLQFEPDEDDDEDYNDDDDDYDAYGHYIRRRSRDDEAIECFYSDLL